MRIEAFFCFYCSCIDYCTLELSTDLTRISFFVLAKIHTRILTKKTFNILFCLNFFFGSSSSLAQSREDLKNNLMELNRLQTLIPLEADQALPELESSKSTKNPLPSDAYLEVISTAHASHGELIQQIESLGISNQDKDQKPQIFGAGVDEQTLEQVRDRVNSPPELMQKVPETDISKLQNSNNSEVSKKLRWTLTLIRLLANGTVTTLSLFVTQDVGLGYAMFIGATVGVTTAALQYHTKTFANWLKNSYTLVRLAEQMKFLKPGASTRVDDLSTKILSETEKYVKWGLTEAVFIKMINLLTQLGSIPTSDVFWLTVLKSTASQGIFDIGITKLSQNLEKNYPHLKKNINNLEHAGLFSSSIISVFSALGALIGLPSADLGFMVLAGGGIILNTYPTYQSFKTKRQCRALFVK